jgi:hypothetical protein
MGKTNNTAGKGDSPRSCFSSQFKSNYDEIVWKKDLTKKFKRILEDIHNDEINNNGSSDSQRPEEGE